MKSDNYSSMKKRDKFRLGLACSLLFAPLTLVNAETAPGAFPPNAFQPANPYMGLGMPQYYGMQPMAAVVPMYPVRSPAMNTAMQPRTYYPAQRVQYPTVPTPAYQARTPYYPQYSQPRMMPNYRMPIAMPMPQQWRSPWQNRVQQPRQVNNYPVASTPTPVTAPSYYPQPNTMMPRYNPYAANPAVRQTQPVAPATNKPVTAVAPTPMPAFPAVPQAQRTPRTMPSAATAQMPMPSAAPVGSFPPVANTATTNRPVYPMRKKVVKKKNAWGDERHIWDDFYTDFTSDAWDTMVNGPFDMGRMPGGWRAPSFSTPDPVTVTDAVANQVPPFAEEMGNMADFTN